MTATATRLLRDHVEESKTSEMCCKEHRKYFGKSEADRNIGQSMQALNLLSSQTMYVVLLTLPVGGYDREAVGCIFGCTDRARRGLRRHADDVNHPRL